MSFTKKRIALIVIFFSILFLAFGTPVFAQSGPSIYPTTEQCRCKYKCVNPQSGGEGDGNINFAVATGYCTNIRTNGWAVPVEASTADAIRQGCARRSRPVDLSAVADIDVISRYVLVSSCASQAEDERASQQIREEINAESAQRTSGAKSDPDQWSCIFNVKPVEVNSTYTTECKDMKKYNENPSLSIPKTEAEARAICYGFCFDPKSPDYRANRPERCRFNNKLTCTEISQLGEGGGQNAKNLSPFELPNSGSLQKFRGTPEALIGKVINAAMGIMGAIALAMYVYGGVIWMTAQGNSENVTRAKSLIVWTSMGVVVMLSSYVLVNFIFDELLF